MPKIRQSSLKRNKTRLILANGSERGEYIPLDHVFSQLGRIHDGIQLMKAYYPNEEIWDPRRKVSEITRKTDVAYAWDFEWEDYHPLDILEEDSVTAKQMEEIKAYGSDVHLTVTLDLSLSDDELEKIFKTLNGYGKVYLRINHEANGNWFRYSVQHTYKEVNDFFIRCHKIIKNCTSNVYTVFNLTADNNEFGKLVLDRNLHLADSGLKEALSTADYWSLDKYSSLHYGWPYSEVVPGKEGKYWSGTIDEWWKSIEETYIKMAWNNGLQMKPLFINEFNSDSDVDGYDGQADFIGSVYSRLLKGDFEWIAGITLYQFRDKGGLGLECGDEKTYRQLPSLKAYRDAIGKFKYTLNVDEKVWGRNEYTFNWSCCDSIRGMNVSDLGGKKKLVNKFGIPVFVVHGEQQSWTRLEDGDSMSLENISEINIFVPPHKKNGSMRAFKLVESIEKNLGEMLV